MEVGDTFFGSNKIYGQLEIWENVNNNDNMVFNIVYITGSKFHV